MPKGDLCGQDAGFLKKRHKECGRKHNEGIAQITALGRTAVLSYAGFDEFAAKAGIIARDAFITPDKLRLLYAAAWESAKVTCPSKPSGRRVANKLRRCCLTYIPNSSKVARPLTFSPAFLLSKA
jgi:hypothetical protein